MMGEAESALQVAEEVAAVVLGPHSDSDDDEFLVEKPGRSSSVTGISDSDLRSLESVAKRARSVSSTMPQVLLAPWVCYVCRPLGETIGFRVIYLTIGYQSPVGTVAALLAFGAECPV